MSRGQIVSEIQRNDLSEQRIIESIVGGIGFGLRRARTTAATKLNHIAFVREICRRGASPMTVAFVARMPAAT